MPRSGFGFTIMTAQQSQWWLATETNAGSSMTSTFDVSYKRGDYRMNNNWQSEAIDLCGIRLTNHAKLYFIDLANYQNKSRSESVSLETQ